MRLYHPFIIFLFWAVAFLSAQNLSETVQIALQNNPQIQAAVHQMQKAQLEAGAAIRRTLPTLSFDASYRHVSDVPELNFDLGPAAPFVMPSVRLGVYDSYESGLTVQYVLFSGFAQKNQVRLKQQQVLIGKTRLSKTKKEIAFRCIVAYREVQQTMLELEALTSARKRIEAQMQRLAILLQHGMTLALDTLSLSLSHLNYEQKQIIAQARLQTARQRLSMLTGREIEVVLPDTSAPAALRPRLVVAQIEDLRRLNLQKKMARASLAVRRAAYFPRVALYASYKYGKPGVDMINNQWMNYGVWGFSVHWNLFSWKADQQNIRAADENLQQIDYLRRVLRDQIQERFAKNLREYESLNAQGRVLRRALQLAKRKMKMVKSQYEQGLSSSTDFTTANLELTETRLKMQRWQVSLALKLNELEFISGKPISAWSL